MKCPKCGFEQPDDIFCARCGIDVEKWRVNTHRKRNLLIGIGICGVGILLFIIVLIFITGGAKNKPSSITETLTATDANLLGKEESSSEEIFQPLSTSPNIPNQPTTSHNAKPLLEENLSSTFNRKAVIEITPFTSALAGKAVKNIGIYAARAHQMTAVTFQLDCGWIKNCPDVWQNGIKLLMLSSELGDKDDSSYYPPAYSNFWRAEARQENERGWAYIYLFDAPPTHPETKYLNFSPSLDKISAKNYKLVWQEDYPFITELSAETQLNILDRQKIRLLLGDSTLTETSLQGRVEVITTGPLMARSRWAGVMTNDNEIVVPVIIENEYLPFGFSSHYEMDFSSVNDQSAALRVYLDFKPLPNLSLYIPNSEEPINIDGKPDEFRYEIGLKSFSIHSANVFLNISITSRSASFFYKDDASQLDSPEENPGCYGCAGFEIPATGTLEFTITYITIEDGIKSQPFPLKIPAVVATPSP